jgi:uncharacterized protein
MSKHWLPTDGQTEPLPSRAHPHGFIAAAAAAYDVVTRALDNRRRGRHGGVLLTHGGFTFDLLRPEESVVAIDDIAHALSNICRFGGHTRVFYSVAQHSVLASYIVEPKHALAALLHDATEAYYTDLVSPLKHLVRAYRSLERRAEAAILSRFGLPPTLPPEVKIADLVMLATERRDLLPDCGGEWKVLRGVKPLNEQIVPLPPGAAKDLFMRRYQELRYGVPAAEVRA